jgi:RHS repeat-associated protein
MIYYGARHYNPGAGRFVEADSLFLREPERCFERPEECQLYSYVANAPTRWVDRDGRNLAAFIAIATLVSIDIGLLTGQFDNFLAKLRNNYYKITPQDPDYFVTIALAYADLGGYLFPTAQSLLRKWAAGDASKKELPYDFLSSFPEVQAKDSLNLNELHDIITNQNIPKFQQLPPEHSLYKRKYVTPGTNQMGLLVSTGDSSLRADPGLKMKKVGSSIDYSLKFVSTWMDVYDWQQVKGDKYFALPPIRLSNTAVHNWGVRRGLQPYLMYSQWSKQINGSYDTCTLTFSKETSTQPQRDSNVPLLIEMQKLIPATRSVKDKF